MTPLIVAEPAGSRDAKQTQRSLACLWLLLVTATAAPAMHAQEHEEPDLQQHGQNQAEAHDEASEHGFHRHHVSLFVGVTDGEIFEESEEGAVVAEDQRAFTLGFDYAYRLSRHWSVGALFDYAGKDFRSFVYGVPVALHPKGGLILYAGPGVEDREDEGREFLVRAGLRYDFKVGRLTVAPALNVDLVDGEEILVYGVNIGKGF